MGKNASRKRTRQRMTKLEYAIATVKAPVFWAAVMMVLLFGALIRHQFALNDRLIHEQSAAADFERHSPDAAWDPSWPALPATGLIAAASPEEIRAPYAFAARRPDILRYIPCYCGCEREGHRSNEDCYLRGRTPAGAPQWSPHSETCAICLGVTRDVMALHAEGKSLAEIRHAIEARYEPRFGHGTPTPLPPGT